MNDSTTPDELNQTRSRVLDVLEFLSALHARRHPPVHDISKYSLDLIRDVALPSSPGVTLSPAGSSWLTVDFVQIPLRPALPDDLAAFVVNRTWSHLDAPRVMDVDDDSTDDERAAIARTERWIAEVWQPWATIVKQLTLTKELYRRLFELRDRIENDRDGVELVWGFGRLLWQHPDVGLLDHPLLTFGVEIDLDTATNQLSVKPAGALTVESLYLSDVPLIDRQGFNSIKATYQNADDAVDPWDDSVRTDLVRRLVRCFDHDSVVADDRVVAPDGRYAQADDGWVLYLRRRQPDYQGFLDSMRELYVGGADVPSPLASLVLAEPSRLINGMDGSGESSRALTPVDQLLLPLAANDEQRRILEDAQTRPGVTVQGPPGTGKSHTIANLISHYVAYGKRVLVVAEKEQALRVLADKVPAGIRDLTVSVLGGDDESRRQLETSVQKIQTRVSGLDRSWVDSEIVRLGTELDQVDRTIAATKQRLMLATQREADRLNGRWLVGENPHVSEVADWLRVNEAQIGYIADELQLSTAAPLTAGELAETVELLQRIGIDTAEHCAADVPPLDSLPAAGRLAELFAALDSFAAAARSVTTELHSLSKVDAASVGDFDALATALFDERQWVTASNDTWLARVMSQMADTYLAPEWPAFLTQVRSEREQILTVGRDLEAHTVAVPAQPGPQFEATLREAFERLDHKGKLGLFAGDAKKALAGCTVDGRQPSTGDDVRLCLAEIRRQQLRQQLITRWANRMERVGGPALDGGRPEDTIGVLIDQLQRAIDTPTRWKALRDYLDSVGVIAASSLTVDVIDRLNEVLVVAKQRKSERAAHHELETLTAVLRTGAVGPDASPLWGLLGDAVNHRHTETWDRLRADVARLQEIAPQALRLLKLLQRLRAAAPVWTARITSDPLEAHDPNQLAAAWQWRQMDCWVAQIVAQDDPARLQRTLETLANRRRDIVAELVEQRAWRRLADNLGDRERAALNKYIAAVNRFGKTGGKYAARFIQMMREALNDSKSAVPVWIMTTNRALTGFRPDQTPPFDVLIIDEASQIGIEAIPLLSLARSTIVVGDDQQTSPESVGQNLESYFELLESHVSKIPDYKALFGDGNSLYNVAFLKFPGVIMLTEHFRCLPEIIEFSNRHVYGNRIVPLRDKPPSTGWPPLGAIKVLDGYRDGKAKLNRPEADAVVDLIEKCCHDPAYDGMDFGVVSMLGTEQSKLIWENLFDRLGPDLMRERHIRCGEPANFQGDERDVMVISMVAATDPSNPGGRIATATSRSDMRRVNVAASRARHQMWVVHSLDASRFNDGDLRGALIRHCSNPGQIEQLHTQLRYESPFEEAVVGRILARGYRRVRTQHDVGRYRIDIVIEGPERRLAVECDGERWHGPERWEADRARQEVLERAGWTFERIRGSSFFRDPDAALEPLWARLDELAIPTGDDWFNAEPRRAVYEVGRRITAVQQHDDDRDDGAGDGRQVGAVQTVTPAEEQPTLLAWPARHERATAAEAPTAAPQPQQTRSTAPESITSHSTTASYAQPHRSIGPYISWQARSLVDATLSRQEHIIDGLVEIIGAEGPMHALRAYQLYNRAAGGHRVGGELRRIFNQATARGIRGGRIAQLDDDIEGQATKTVYLPGSAPVIVRELGPRTLNDIPLSELRELTKILGVSETPAVHRAVLDALGLTRLTQNAQDYIDEAMRYTYRATGA
jgi:very-short-patch-repair endonuclease